MLLLQERILQERLVLEGAFLVAGWQEPLVAHAEDDAVPNYGIARWSGKQEKLPPQLRVVLSLPGRAALSSSSW